MASSSLGVCVLIPLIYTGTGCWIGTQWLSSISSSLAYISMGFPGSSVVKNLPPLQELQETQFQSPGQEDPPGEGHGNPLQYSCLENPMDKGAWWATVHGVAKSRTWLKRLSMHTYISTDFISKHNHSHRYWGLQLEYIFQGNRMQSILTPKPRIFIVVMLVKMSCGMHQKLK